MLYLCGIIIYDNYEAPTSCSNTCIVYTVTLLKMHKLLLPQGATMGNWFNMLIHGNEALVE